MTPENKIARSAGLLYLIVVVTGIFGLMYVPGQIGFSDDAQSTYNNIVASESLFRSGIAALIINQVAFLLLPFVLFMLLRPVNERIAVLMVALAVVSVPIALVALSNRMDILSMLPTGRFADVFTSQELQGQVLLSLDAYRKTMFMATIFWGLWLLPFGYLVFKSGFLPKLLGIFLMLGCFGYLIDDFGFLLIEGYNDLLIADFVTKPASIGEIGTCLWLLIVGVRGSKTSGPMNEDAMATT